jgi:hypothetical protein
MPPTPNLLLLPDVSAKAWRFFSSKAMTATAGSSTISRTAEQQDTHSESRVHRPVLVSAVHALTE